MRSTLTLGAIVLSALLNAQDHGFGTALSLPGTSSPSYQTGAVHVDGSIALASTDASDMTSNLHITRLHADGSLNWNRRMVITTAGSVFYARKICFRPDGSLLVFGLLYASSSKYFLIALDAEGGLLWSHTYDVDVDENFGDYGFSSMHPTNDGGANLSLGMTKRSMAMHVDAAGEVVWTRSFITDDVPTEKNPAFDFAPLPDDGMLITEKAENDIFLVRVDASGELLWSQRYPNGTYNHAKSAIPLSTGGFLIVGYSEAAAMAMRIDDSGNLLWRRTYTASDINAWCDVFVRAFELPSGEILLSPSISSWGVRSVTIDPNGDVVGAYNSTSTEISTELIGMHQGQMIMTGVRTVFDQQSGWTSTLPVFKSPLDMSAVCEPTAVLLSHQDSPPVTQAMEGCTVIDVPVSAEAFPSLSASSVAMTSEPLCVSVTATPELSAADLAIHPTLLSAGTPITVQGIAVDRLGYEHIAADGRGQRVTSSPARNGTAQLSTVGWAAGLHVVRAVDATGRVVAVVRVVVDR